MMDVIDRRISRINDRIKRLRYGFILLGLLMLIAGMAFTWFIWSKNSLKQERQAVSMARLASAALNQEELLRLTGQPTDVNTDYYLQLKKALAVMKEAHPDIAIVYLYRPQGDELVFLVDSEGAESKLHSFPGDVYSEADPDYWIPVTTGQITLTGRVSDRWGEWVSVLHPIYDKSNGDLIAVFSMDYAASRWLADARIRTALTALIMLLLILIMSGFFLIYKRNLQIRREKESLSQLNRQLTDQETMFQIIFEQSPIGMSIGNKESAYIDVNEAYESIVGYSKDDLRAHNWKDHTHPDDLTEDLNQMEKFMAGEIDNYSMVKRYIRPNQEIVWVHMKIDSISIGNEEERYYICMIENIDDYMQAADKLRESERSKAALLSNLPGMAYRCLNDADWTMLYVSEGCFDLTGYLSSELLHNRNVAFNDLITPEFRAAIRGEWDRVLTERQKFKYEYTIQTADGSSKWVYEQGQGIYDEDGSVVALEGMIIDISELKARENEIQHILNHDFLTGLFNRNYFNSSLKSIDKADNLPLSVIMGDINGLRLINDAFGHDKGDELIRLTAHIIKDCCREQDILCRTGGDEFSILLPRTSARQAHVMVHKIRDSLELKLSDADKMFAVNLSVGYGTKTDKNKDFSLTVKEAENHMNKRKLLEGKSSHSAIISSIKAAMFARSRETEAHASRMAENTRLLGENLGLSESQLNELELLATLHDIGKIGIDDRIMTKPEPLTADEWIQMKKHPEIGYRIAMSTPELVPIAEYILCHHERWDGNGYPQGLKGEKIPLLSRVLAVADAYDAMTENRVYRRAITNDEAVAEIARCAGSQFDPRIAGIFVELFSGRH
jgi:diguanylate cyclase (GGDEF)-like protein/PAS domain S-box-containing protein